ncbi:hypothetical protein SAMN04487970_10971 [Paenibacillus tianmuensis]|uniref:Uncharacterized protein n=1 Tax=Paenibacillus tianmuensis TaxID=624147 RepID=A0A1G4U1P0_9BACL|nr:hypothetical protein SAMN04487970_10971 [Paenibacillus tianmuensis]
MEDLEDMDVDSRRDYYETFQMCNYEGNRYVHIMRHYNYPENLRVGQQGAVNSKHLTTFSMM